MILTWTPHRVLTEMKNSTYKQHYLRIYDNGPGNFTGFAGDLDHEFNGETAEEVEAKMISFIDGG